MLEIITGRAGSGKTARIFNLISENIKAAVQGQFYLTPDHYTHEAERRLCSLCGNGASLYCEVITPARLAERFFALAGGRPESVLDNGGRILALRAALENSMEFLTLYKSAARTPEFTASLMNMLDEMHTHGIESWEISKAAGQCEGALSAKLYDLAMIFSEYRSVLGDANDPGDILTLLAKGLIKNPVFAGRVFYIDGFSGFTPQESAVICELIRHCRVHIALTCETLGHPDNSNIFIQNSSAFNTLSRYCEKYSIPFTHIHLAHADKIPAFKAIDRGIYDYDAPECLDSSGVELHSCDNPWEECELAAAWIKQTARDNGYRYRDFAVYARDFSRYEGIIEETFARYDVPVYLDRAGNAAERPAIRQLISGFSLAFGGYHSDAMCNYIKSGFSGLDGETAAGLYDYARRYNIRYGMWTKPFRLNPEGFQKESDASNELLSRLNAARERLISPLERLRKSMKEHKTVRAYATAFYNYLLEIDFYNSLRKSADTLLESGETQAAEETPRLFEVLMEALDQYVSILGEREVTPPEFVKMLRLSLSQYTIGSIPVFLDAVAAGEADRVRTGGIKVLLVLGANDGSFPQNPLDDPILSSKERRTLRREHGLTLPPCGYERMESERFVAYRLLTAPSEKLYISYPINSTEGTSCRKSPLIDRIEELLPGALQENNKYYYAFGERPLLERAISGRYPASREYLAAVGRFSEISKICALSSHRRSDSLPNPLAQALWGRKLNISASRVDTYHSCPYAYFMKYGLGVSKRREIWLDPLETGKFLHYILERTADEVSQLGGFKKVPQSRVLEIARAAALAYRDEYFLPMISENARLAYLFGRLVTLAERIVSNMARELAGGSFEALAFELDFGPGGKIPALTLESEDNAAQISLRGKIDRVDGWIKDGQLYLRVVDYKSGAKSFSFSDIRYGLGLQLLIYLLVVTKNGRDYFGKEALPAGALYLPAALRAAEIPKGTPPEATEALLDKELKRSGLVVSDMEIILAMENNLSGIGRYIPVQINKDGEISGQSQVASLEEMGLLSRHVEETLRAMARELSRGEISARPACKGGSSPCDFCDYISICRFDPAAGDRANFIQKTVRGEFLEKLSEKYRGGEQNGR